MHQWWKVRDSGYVLVCVCLVLIWLAHHSSKIWELHMVILVTFLLRPGDVFASSWRRFQPVLETFLPRLWRRFHLVLETSSGRSDCGLYDVLLRSWWSSFCYGYSVLKTSSFGLEIGRGKTSWRRFHTHKWFTGKRHQHQFHNMHLNVSIFLLGWSRLLVELHCFSDCLITEWRYSEQTICLG